MYTIQINPFLTLWQEIKQMLLILGQFRLQKKYFSLLNAKQINLKKLCYFIIIIIILLTSNSYF